jgi:hypothetical protein
MKKLVLPLAPNLQFHFKKNWFFTLPPTYSIMKKLVQHFAANIQYHENTGSALCRQPIVS